MEKEYINFENTIGLATNQYNGIFVPSKLHPCGWEYIELNNVDGMTYVIFNENYDHDVILIEFGLDNFTNTTFELKLEDFLGESNIEYFSFDNKLNRRFILDGKWKRVI